MAILARIKKASKFSDLLKRLKKEPVLKISDYLDVNNIIFLSGKNRDSSIRELIDQLCISGKLQEKEKFYKKIIERENFISTGIGMGVAIPHAKMAIFDDFFIAIGIHKKYKINWGSIDQLPVRLIFMIGGPEIKQNEYLQLLSKITIAIKDDDLRRNILKSSTESEIFKLFNQI